MFASVLACGAALVLLVSNAVAQANPPQQAHIVRIDADHNTITLRMKDKEGKEVDKTIQLGKDVTLYDEQGKVIRTNVLKIGRFLLVVEREGKVAELRVAQPEGDERKSATVTAVDPVKKTITIKLKDRNGRDTEQTVEIKGDLVFYDAAGRAVAEIGLLKPGRVILATQRMGKIIELRLPKPATPTAKNKEK